MDLWTEFEGATVDSTFSLTRLLQPEGRSAFFATTNAKGESVLIRIVECHFDEDEILTRWRAVQALGHPNFLSIDQFGKFRIESEDCTAVYAVFERVDANLGEVLQRGHLTAVDATEIGLSLCLALEALHSNGFVHEHVEAANIYAVDSAVKLRGDCIREAPEGVAGVEARQRDVEGLGRVLTQVLLGRGVGSAARPETLEAPFGEIVRGSTEGSWGLSEVRAALGRKETPKAVPPRATAPALAEAREKVAASEPLDMETAEDEDDFVVGALPFERPSATGAETGAATGAATGQAGERLGSRAARVAAYEAAARGDLPPKKRGAMDLPVIFGISEDEFRRWRNAAALFVVVVFLGWLLLHHWFGHRTADAAPQPQPSAAASAPRVAAAPEPAGVALGSPVTGARGNWRVIAFTYNRHDQAQKKAAALAQRHPGLRPAVFSPTGRAPWLVTVGGSLQREEAYALARKARSLGLPHDTYAQNYTAR